MLPTDRTPVICASPSFVTSAGIFNPNGWSGGGKGIIQSCGAEYSTLCYAVTELTATCNRSEELCRSQIEDLIANWKRAPFDVSRCDCFVDVPSYHLLVEGFFSGVKSLLDLIVQLLQSERIVNAAIHGFHEQGERILRVLAGNPRKERRGDARRIAEFLQKQKVFWIDELIELRDDLVHPKKGMMQIMFQVDLTEETGRLVWKVREQPIACYAPATLLRVQQFCETFLALVQGMPLGSE